MSKKNRYPTQEEVMSDDFNPMDYLVPEIQREEESIPIISNNEAMVGFREIEEDIPDAPPVNKMPRVNPQQELKKLQALHQEHIRNLNRNSKPEPVVNIKDTNEPTALAQVQNIPTGIQKRIEESKRAIEESERNMRDSHIISNIPEDELRQLLAGHNPRVAPSESYDAPDLEDVLETMGRQQNEHAPPKFKQNTNKSENDKPSAKPKPSADAEKRTSAEYIRSNNLSKLSTDQLTFSDEPGSVVEENSENEDYPDYKISNNKKVYSDRFERPGLVSNAVFYDDYFSRSLNPKNLINMQIAIQNKSYTALIDVLNNCVYPIDIRGLTLADFTWFLYWLRMRSYPKTPIEYFWKSRYGNDNKLTMEKEIFKFEHPEISREEYKDYVSRGFVIPTLRDHELLITGNLSPSQIQTYTRAQYLAGNTPAEKVAKFENAEDLSIMEDIKLFADKISHRVIEQIKGVDVKFNVDAATKFMTEKCERFKRQMGALSDRDTDKALEYLNAIVDIEDELKEFAVKKENGEKILPREEEIAIAVDVRKFFS